MIKTEKILQEIERLESGIKDELKKGNNFKQFHIDTLNLCELIFKKKADYKKIRIEYPEQNYVEICLGKNFHSRNPIHEEKKLKSTEAELAKDLLTILQNAHHKYSQKLRLET